MSEIFNRNKVQTDPPTSDSKIYVELEKGKKEYIYIIILMVISFLLVFLGIFFHDGLLMIWGFGMLLILIIALIRVIYLKIKF